MSIKEIYLEYNNENYRKEIKIESEEGLSKQILRCSNCGIEGFVRCESAIPCPYTKNNIEKFIKSSN